MQSKTVTEADVAAFMEERRRDNEERLRVEALVEKYQQNMPQITAQWDRSASAVDHNDIHADYLKDGVSIYACSMSDLWQGIFEPAIYDANTLWSDDHEPRKIAKVIEAWESGQVLSPILLAKHLSKNLAVVPDGKHRLTVSRAIEAVDMLFMVLGDDPAWVSKAFPGAKRIV